jgi:hypothetical protein
MRTLQVSGPLILACIFPNMGGGDAFDKFPESANKFFLDLGDKRVVGLFIRSGVCALRDSKISAGNSKIRRRTMRKLRLRYSRYTNAMPRVWIASHS